MFVLEPTYCGKYCQFVRNNLCAMATNWHVNCCCYSNRNQLISCGNIINDDGAAGMCAICGNIGSLFVEVVYLAEIAKQTVLQDFQRSWCRWIVYSWYIVLWIICSSKDVT